MEQTNLPAPQDATNVLWMDRLKDVLQVMNTKLSLNEFPNPKSESFYFKYKDNEFCLWLADERQVALYDSQDKTVPRLLHVFGEVNESGEFFYPCGCKTADAFYRKAHKLILDGVDGTEFEEYFEAD